MVDVQHHCEKMGSEGTVHSLLLHCTTRCGAQPDLSCTNLSCGIAAASLHLPPVLQLAHELVAPRRLEERVNGILMRLEKELDQADEAIGE
jgi:hypothetical protein